MPIFVCDNCKCIENTALGQYWSVGRSLFPKEFDDKKLCSECASPIYTDDTPTGKGKWHGKFEKMHIDDHMKKYPDSELTAKYKNSELA